MINVSVIAVGGLKEKHFAAAAAEYQKRLGAFCSLHISEVDEYRLPKNPSRAEIEHGLADEAKRIIAKIPRPCFTFALCVEGQRLSSEAFSGKVASLAAGGASSLAFLIGGSLGLDEGLKSQCDFRLSMSDMTFPHQLARVMLMEQLYRAFAIQNSLKYHK